MLTTMEACKKRQSITLTVDHSDAKVINRLMIYRPDERAFALGIINVARQFYNTSGPDVDEWLQVVMDNWLTTEGRYCSPQIVAEFKVNMQAVLSLVKETTQSVEAYPRLIGFRKKSRLVKR